MAWDRPPPVDFAQIELRLLKLKAHHRAALNKIEKQLVCNHTFVETKVLNLGGEREASVTCLGCGYEWY